MTIHLSSVKHQYGWFYNICGLNQVEVCLYIIFFSIYIYKDRSLFLFDGVRMSGLRVTSRSIIFQ